MAARQGPPALIVDRSTASATSFLRDEVVPQEDAGGYMSDDAATRGHNRGTRKINKTFRQLNPFKVVIRSLSGQVPHVMRVGHGTHHNCPLTDMSLHAMRSNERQPQGAGGSTPRSSLPRRCPTQYIFQQAVLTAAHEIIS